MYDDRKYDCDCDCCDDVELATVVSYTIYVDTTQSYCDLNDGLMDVAMDEGPSPYTWPRWPVVVPAKDGVEPQRNKKGRTRRPSMYLAGVPP